jgi:signal transduction histidine kinase
VVDDLPTPLPVVGDARLLEQVLVNLLANVYRHTPAGTRVTLAGHVTADEVCLTVRDDGPGLPPAELETIFARFHRADAAAGGSGLGLAIAREIAALHGGRLWAENAAEGGAAFHLALPHDMSDAEAAGQHDEGAAP